MAFTGGVGGGVGFMVRVTKTGIRTTSKGSPHHLIVLSQGRIVEQGTFQELLQQERAFAEMARRQGITP
jgi:hypothetical protein